MPAKCLLLLLDDVRAKTLRILKSVRNVNLRQVLTRIPDLW
jgi:hypothetical protein